MRQDLLYVTTLVACSALLPRSASAVVTTVDAEVSAAVVEFEDGALINSVSAFEDLDDTTGQFPIETEVVLIPADEDDDFSGAFAVMSIDDPTTATLPNPAEFGVNIGVFSDMPGITHTSDGSAVETREVTFTADEIDASPDTPLTARSFFFVDGIILIWSQVGQTDLSNTLATTSLHISQTRSIDDSPEELSLIDASLSLSGAADGSADAIVTGDLDAANVIVLDLSDAIADLGQLHVMFVPALAIPYTYDALTDEEFELQASISANVANRFGTGAAVVLGADLESLASLISQVTGSDAATTALNLLTAQKAINTTPQRPLIADQDSTVVEIQRSFGLPFLPLACASLGGETALLGIIFFSFTLIRARSRRYRQGPMSPDQDQGNLLPCPDQSSGQKRQ